MKKCRLFYNLNEKLKHCRFVERKLFEANCNGIKCCESNIWFTESYKPCSQLLFELSLYIYMYRSGFGFGLELNIQCLSKSIFDSHRPKEKRKNEKCYNFITNFVCLRCFDNLICWGIIVIVDYFIYTSKRFA